MRYFFILLLTSIFAGSSYSQTIETAGSGDWDETTTWVGGLIPDASNSSLILINDSHEINIPSGFTATVDEVYIDLFGMITVDDGGVLDLQDGTGDDLQIFNDGIDNGFLVINGRFILNQGATAVEEEDGPPGGSPIETLTDFTTTVGSTGIFELAYTTTAGEIIGAQWDTGSTVEITGYTSNTSVPAGIGQNFFNFTWNCVNQTGNVTLDGAITNIGGDLTISNTGSNNRSLRLSTSVGNFTTTIGGDLNITNNSRVTGWSSATNVVYNILGDFNYTSTALNAFGSSGTGIINITGDFNVNPVSGTFRAATSSGMTTINIGGNFTFTSGTIDSDNGITDPGLTFVFNGGGVQSFTGGPGATFSDNINFIVDNNSTLDLGAEPIAGDGDFTLNAGSTLRLGSLDADGALQDNTTGGNIQVEGTRTFNSGSTIVYNGVAAQFMGSGHPSTTNIDLIIDNANGVTMASDVTVGGDLTLTSGNISIGANQLTLQGIVTAGANFINMTSSSDVIINGSGTFGTFPFAAGDQMLNNFTFDRASETVVFGTNVTVNGDLSLNNGTLNFSDQSLTLLGTLSGSGSFISNSSSTLSTTGSGALGTIRFDNTGNTLGTLSMDRNTAGSVVLGSTLNISTALNMTNGTFDNSGAQTLIMADNATLTRNANATFSGRSPETTTGAYNIVYTGGALTVADELPDESDDLNNLEINGGPVTLNQDLQVNGSVTLSSGSLSIGTSNLTVLGDWVRNSGSLSAYTGQVIFNGTTNFSGTNTATFSNITVGATAVVTFPSGNINIDGNMQLNPTSTVDANGGTITLGGTSDQSLAVGGATFNNLDIDKTSGNVTIGSQLNMTGEMSFLSSSTSTINTGGLLTLLSTSDGTSGNGSIGVVPAAVTITGNVTVQRFMSGEGRIFRYISSPVSGASLEDWRDDFPITGTFSDPSTGTGIVSGNASLYRYDESVPGLVQEGWEAYPASGNLVDASIEVGRGYAAFIREDVASTTVDVTGPLNVANVSNIDLNVTYNDSGNGATNEGWNLVGNPFPATIDWDNILSGTGGTRTNVNNGIQVRDNGAGGMFRTYDGTLTGDLTDGLIATGQAFWVQANASSPVLTLNESAKSNTPTLTGTFYRTRSERPATVQIQLSDGQYHDNAFVALEIGTLIGYDQGKDTPNLNNQLFDVTTFGADSTDLAINYLDNTNCQFTVPINVADIQTGAMTLDFLQLETLSSVHQVMLHDKFLQTTLNIIDNPHYEFDVDKDVPDSYGNGRFELEFLTNASDLELSLTTSDVVCKDASGMVAVSDPEIGFTYQAMLNNELYGDPVQYTGDGDLEFNFDDDVLLEGENTVSIMATLSQCPGQASSSTLLTKSLLAPEISEQDGMLTSNYDDGNQWFYNGELIPGATGKTLDFQNSGNYTLEVNSNGCTASTSREFLITGIETDLQNALRLFPNPTSDFWTLEFPAEMNNVSLKIVDIHGKEVYSVLDITTNKVVIPAEDMKQGLYLLSLISEDKIWYQRIVKN